MRPAFTLLGIMTCIVFVGAYIVFHEKAEAPLKEDSEEVAPVDTLDNSQSETMTLTLTSPSFTEGGQIPQKYTCDGENINPEIHVSGIPEGTESLVLVMDDPDIPESVKQARGIQKFDHWVLYNIPPQTEVIKEGEPLGTGGLNSRGESVYAGPCPPDREHRYIFRLYALSGALNFIQAPTLDQVEEATRGMMIEKVELIGTYERSNNI